MGNSNGSFSRKDRKKWMRQYNRTVVAWGGLDDTAG
jgi:hypothetical protein